MNGRPYRVPFVRRCHVTFGNGQVRSTFTVNINGQGVYLAADTMPTIGEMLLVRFRTAGSEHEVTARGIAAWLNPNQAHRVHSLPPGYGVQFVDLPEPGRSLVDAVVEEYLARNPPRN